MLANGTPGNKEALSSQTWSNKTRPLFELAAYCLNVIPPDTVSLEICQIAALVSGKALLSPCSKHLPTKISFGALLLSVIVNKVSSLAILTSKPVFGETLPGGTLAPTCEPVTS